MSKLKNKVINIKDKRTSVRLCNSEWYALEDICKRESISRRNLVETIEEHRNGKLGLTGSIRLFSIAYYHELLNQTNTHKKFPIEQVIKKLF